MAVVPFKRRRRGAWRLHGRAQDAALIAIGLAGFAFAGVTTWEHGFTSGRQAYASEASQAYAPVSRSGGGARRVSAYYANCDAVRAAGAAPLNRGEPGYRPKLDADNDGIACEPYRRG